MVADDQNTSSQNGSNGTNGACSSMTFMKALITAGVLGKVHRRVFLVAELGEPVRLYTEDEAEEQAILRAFAGGLRVEEVIREPIDPKLT